MDASGMNISNATASALAAQMGKGANRDLSGFKGHPQKRCRFEVCFDATTGKLLAKGARAEEYYNRSHVLEAKAGRPMRFLAFDGPTVHGYDAEHLMANPLLRVKFAANFFVLSAEAQATANVLASRRGSSHKRKLARRASGQGAG